MLTHCSLVFLFGPQRQAGQSRDKTLVLLYQVFQMLELIGKMSDVLLSTRLTPSGMHTARQTQIQTFPLWTTMTNLYMTCHAKSIDEINGHQAWQYRSIPRSISINTWTRLMPGCMLQCRMSYPSAALSWSVVGLPVSGKFSDQLEINPDNSASRFQAHDCSKLDCKTRKMPFGDRSSSSRPFATVRMLLSKLVVVSSSSSSNSNLFLYPLRRSVICRTWLLIELPA